MMTFTSGVLPNPRMVSVREGTATSSCGQTPLQPFPARHPMRSKPCESHTNDTGGQPITEHLTGYLDPILAGIKSYRQC